MKGKKELKKLPYRQGINGDGGILQLASHKDKYSIVPILQAACVNNNNSIRLTHPY